MNTKHLLSIFTSLILISLMISGGLAASPAIEEAIDRGLDFIADHQNTDGGFFEPNTDKTSIRNRPHRGCRFGHCHFKSFA